MYTFSAYWPYYKRNLKVAFPLMLTQFGAALVGLADSIMVGHYSTADLAAGLGAAAISGNSRHQAVRGQDEHLGERAVQV